MILKDTPLKEKGLHYLSSNLVLQGIQRGLIYVLPLVVVGAFALCLISFPFPSALGFLDILFGSGWRPVCESIVQGTFGITSLAVVGGVSVSIAELLNLRKNAFQGNPRMTTVVALACYIIILGPCSVWESNFSLGEGMVTAVFTAVTASYLFYMFSSWKKYRLPFVNVGHNLLTSDYLILLPAGALTILVFAVGYNIYSHFLADSIGMMHSHVMHSIVESNIGELGIGLLYAGFSQVFWFFGIHGPNMLFSVERDILTPAMLENVKAAAVALPPPHIVTKGFIDIFARIGGSGSTLALIIAILLKGKEIGTKRLCLVALLPAICSVNEPLIFGIPLVFNPLYAIPFILTPVVQTLVAYLATALNIVAPTVVDIHWSTPVFFSGYVSTQSLSGVVMQVVNLGIGVGLYMPFVGYSEDLHLVQARKALSSLLKNATDALPGPRGKQCLTRPGIEGYLARVLADDLANAITNKKQLSLMFQPQVDIITGHVTGVESLLHWDHPVYGYIPPTVIVALAEDIKLIDALGSVALEGSCNCLADWKETVPEDFLMSVNLSAEQFRNPKLADQIIVAAARANVSTSNLQMEITETLALTADDSTNIIFNTLRDYGVKVAIDDFSMGHTSLRCLRNFPVDTVKINMSLTVETANGVTDHIVKSIVDLAGDLKIKTVVKGVETVEQVDRFTNLGCSLYQGFYFSHPLHADDCLNFIKTRFTTPK